MKIRNSLHVPVIAIVGAVVVFSLVLFFAIQKPKTTVNENLVANVTANTSVSINENANVTANVNDAVNSNSSATNTNNTTVTTKYPAQEWPGAKDDKVIYRMITDTTTDKTLYSIQPGQKAQTYSTLPTSYTQASDDRGRLTWLSKDNHLFVFDHQDGSIRQTSLPDILAGDVRFESAGPSVYSTDGVEVLIRYDLFDKNSDAYKNEFAGPQPSSSKLYRYNLTTDTFVTADNMKGDFWSIWDRQANVGYTHRTGEGVGNSSPITKKLFDAGKTEKSADYSTNSVPAFSQDGKWAAVPSVDKAPMKIYIFSLPDIANPVQTLTLPTVKDTPPVTNAIGYVYDFEWSTDNQNLLLSFQNTIYHIDVKAGTAIKIFENRQSNSSGTGWDYYPVVSGSGRYIYFVDYSNKDPKTLKKGNNISELKAYDATTAKTTTLVTTTGEQRMILTGQFP